MESANGYLAKSDSDNMLWTPKLDKKIFKLLTYACGGVCVCSKKTYDLLPYQMLNDKNRKFIIATRDGSTTLPKLNKKISKRDIGWWPDIFDPGV